MAFSNSLSGIALGIKYIDTTLYCMGRCAGNCPTELAYLIKYKNSTYDLRPILQVAESKILPFKKDFYWGYKVPHLLVGIFNEHPDTAMNKYRNVKQIVFEKLQICMTI
jgi:4-hydroxy 2-oxovalerate aldolase